MPKKKIDEPEKRKIKFKNYCILFFICAVTICVALGLRNWYISYQEYQLTIPVLKDKISEVTDEFLDSYVAAHPDTILYIQVNDDENSRVLGNKLYDVLKKRNLLNDSVFINIGNLDKENFMKDFNENYSNGKKVSSYPAVVIFNDGKVKDLVERKNSSQFLNIGDVEQLFDEYEIEGM